MKFDETCEKLNDPIKVAYENRMKPGKTQLNPVKLGEVGWNLRESKQAQ